MKSFAVFLAVLAVAAASVKEEWTSFKTSHGKKYSGEEEEIRYSIWEANKEMVEAHNAAGHSWTMALYEWSDWTQEEFEEKKLGYKKGDLPSGETVIFDDSIPRAQDIDYRNEGKVSQVQNQGQCGSCWAFSGAGAIEGMTKANGGQLINLSEQQFLDCCQGSCQGGLEPMCFENGRNGVMAESSYPYEGRDGSCRFHANQAVTRTNGYRNGGGGESGLESTLAQVGYPVSVAVHVGSSFQHYSGGIFSDPSCANGQLNHAVLAVGFKKSGGTPYWIVKNSWGGSWGESGYIYARQGENFCGISNDVSYPI